MIAIAALVVVPLLVSPERWSLAAFYRGKLRIAYGTYRVKMPWPSAAVPWPLSVYENDTNTKDKHAREPWLHSFRAPGHPNQVSTPLTVCAAATVSSRSVKTHYGIPALSVTFDPGYVTVHVPTSDPRGSGACTRRPRRSSTRWAPPPTSG